MTKASSSRTPGPVRFVSFWNAGMVHYSYMFLALFSVGALTIHPDHHPPTTQTNKGLVSMVSAGVHRNAAHFHIATDPCPHMDGRAVAFGRVVEGMEVVKKVRFCVCVLLVCGGVIWPWVYFV